MNISISIIDNLMIWWFWWDFNEAEKWAMTAIEKLKFIIRDKKNNAVTTRLLMGE